MKARQARSRPRKAAAEPSLFDWVVKRCDETYRRGNWAARGVLPASGGITAEAAHWRPHPEQHTIAEIVRHMAYWKDVVTAQLDGRPWKFDEQQNWRPAAPGEPGWADARKELQAAHGRLMRSLRSFPPGRLLEPAGKAWWSRAYPLRKADLIVDIATHDSYHAAQIFVLRRLFRGARKSRRDL